MSGFLKAPSRVGRAVAIAILASCATSPRGPAAPEPTRWSSSGRGLDEVSQARQAITRLTFGAHAGDLDAVRAVGVDRWIDRQLDPARIPDSTAERFLRLYETQQRDARSLVEELPPQDIRIRNLRRERQIPDSVSFVMNAGDSAAWKGIADRANRLANELLSARLARAELTDRQLQEVVTDFWENHFSVFAGKMPTRFTLLEYDRDVIRPRALGRFRDLLGAVAHSSAMLYYLDNAQSVADSAHPTLREWEAAQRNHGTFSPRRRRAGLNENYARELMELHTLGVDGGYSQHDVIEVARALTGWSVEDPRRGGGFVFRPEAHDADPKLVLGHRLPAGRGIEDGEEVLDLVARHPSTARFISRKLCIRFVSDTPPPALVERATETFTRTGGDIRETLRTILHSPEFFSVQAYHAKVKSPFELVVSVRRALGAFPDTTARTAQLVARLGEPIFGHQAPNGWPETGEAWVNSGTILERINFGANVVAGRVPGVTLERWPASLSLVTAPPAGRVEGVIGALLLGEALPATRAALGGAHTPSDARDGGKPSSLGDLVVLALGSPEFQRR